VHQEVPLAGGRPALLHAPPGARRGLLVFLHGAGGTASGALDLVRRWSDAHGIAVLAPQAVAATWDLLVRGFGPDVLRLDDALRAAGAEAGPLAVGGFSDGASYALSLGLTNGDLFGDVLAFSPGFLAPAELRGRPRIHVCHGVADRVLPIDRCSRRLVPALRDAGYRLTYREFDGGHVVPGALADEALTWLDWPDPGTGPGDG
jgi:predicted esterase